MTWFAVYEDATGRLESVGTIVAPAGQLVRRGLVAKELPSDPRTATKRWNETTRVFDDVAVPKPVLAAQDLLARFTPTEREDVFDAARLNLDAGVKKAVQAFVDWLKIVSEIDLGDRYLIDSVNALEAAGLIGAGRAAEVLS